MQDITSVIHEIQQGNERLREEFIASSRETIRRYASFLCKRQLEWQNDDELSISLIAFNRGIDSYDPRKGKGFYPYVRLIIKNSLIDHFKSQSKKGNPQTVPLPLSLTESPARSAEEQTKNAGTGGPPAASSEGAAGAAAASLQAYHEEQARQERAYEITLFKEVLAEFSLSLQELALSSPKHGDTRRILKEAARLVAEEKELANRIFREKKLPLQEIELLTGIKRKTLERWRRYLLSLVIVWTHEELEEMTEYLWGKESLHRK